MNGKDVWRGLGKVGAFAATGTAVVWTFSVDFLNYLAVPPKEVFAWRMASVSAWLMLMSLLGMGVLAWNVKKLMAKPIFAFAQFGGEKKRRPFLPPPVDVRGDHSDEQNPLDTRRAR